MGEEREEWPGYATMIRRFEGGEKKTGGRGRSGAGGRWWIGRMCGFPHVSAGHRGACSPQNRAHSRKKARLDAGSHARDIFSPGRVGGSVWRFKDN